jgi:hypothetical protein
LRVEQREIRALQRTGGGQQRDACGDRDKACEQRVPQLHGSGMPVARRIRHL